MGIIARFKNWLKEQIEFEMFDAQCRMEEARGEIDELKSTVKYHGDKLTNQLNDIAKTFEDIGKSFK